MSLQIVQAHLQQWAAGSADKARRANDPDSIAALRKAEEQFRRLSALVQAGIAELAAHKAAVASKPATKRHKAGISALEFWRRHGIAVEGIIAVYGRNWKIKAPIGETELVIVPAGWRSCRTERGTLLKWGPDHRVPAARYWPSQILPPALTVTPDYPRASPIHSLVGRWQQSAKHFRQLLRDRRIRLARPWVEEDWRVADIEYALMDLRQAREALRAAGGTPGSRVAEGERDALWYQAHGYVYHFDTDHKRVGWVREVEVRVKEIVAEQIRRDKDPWRFTNALIAADVERLEAAD